MRRLNELERRLANVILPATILEADYSRARVRAQAGELVTGWLPWVAGRAGGDSEWWAPQVGEQVLILSPYGQPEVGFVLPTIYQNRFPAPDDSPDRHATLYRDGATIKYDSAAHHLEAVLPSGATARLAAPGGARIEGDVTVVGDLRVEGTARVTDKIVGESSIEDETSTLQAMRDAYNAHTHGVTGVQPRME